MAAWKADVIWNVLMLHFILPGETYESTPVEFVLTIYHQKIISQKKFSKDNYIKKASKQKLFIWGGQQDEDNGQFQFLSNVMSFRSIKQKTQSNI